LNKKKRIYQTKTITKMTTKKTTTPDNNKDNKKKTNQHRDGSTIIG